MENSIETIKANYQEVLKRKVEERDAELALNLIDEYEDLKKRFEKMQGYVKRLEAGEDVGTVMNEYYYGPKRLGTEDCYKETTMAGTTLVNKIY